MTDISSVVSDKPAAENSATPDSKQKLSDSFTKDAKENLEILRSMNPLPKNTSDDKMLDEVEHAHFNYFVHQSDPDTGLTKDRSTPDSAASIAAVGFSLTAYPIGAERGWVSRDQAADYTLKVLNTLWNAPQGDAAQGEASTHGFFYHFLDPKKATRMWNSEVSTIDTSLLMSGVLFSKDYFNGNSPKEAEIRDLADKLYKRVDWPWMLNKDNRVSMGWTPEAGYISSDWQGYNEAMIMQLQALGSPTHPLNPDVWTKYHSTDTIRDYGGQKYIDFPPQFAHQYSESWVDFRGINDAKNKSLGFDYFENSRRATLAQNFYGDKNPPGFRGYSKLDWGWTASDGPGANVPPPADVAAPGGSDAPAFGPHLAEPEPEPQSAYELRTGGRHDQPDAQSGSTFVPAFSGGGFDARVAKTPTFLSYSARGAPDYIDDGTIAPTAAAASLPFAPELVLPTLRHWREDRPEIWSEDGFKDAFNPTADPSKPSGWIDTDTIGIDQGPIVLMTENYRSGLVWNTIKRDPYLTEGLRKAGFTGGWLDQQKASGK